MEKMICSICKNGSLEACNTTVTLNKGETTIVIKDVPAFVCDDCGEYWLDDSVTKKVYQMAEEARSNTVLSWN